MNGRLGCGVFLGSRERDVVLWFFRFILSVKKGMEKTLLYFVFALQGMKQNYEGFFN